MPTTSRSDSEYRTARTIAYSVALDGMWCNLRRSIFYYSATRETVDSKRLKIWMTQQLDQVNTVDKSLLAKSIFTTFYGLKSAEKNQTVEYTDRSFVITFYSEPSSELFKLTCESVRVRQKYLSTTKFERFPVASGFSDITFVWFRDAS